MRRNSGSAMPVWLAMSAISVRMRSIASASFSAKAAHFLSFLAPAVHPAQVELVADIGIEEIDPLDLVPFGQAQHLAAQARSGGG